jgi:signal transduction histidine kinase
MPIESPGPVEATTARVLLVEDDEHIRELVKLHLGLEGHAAVATDDGADGLRLARAEPFDLLILDVMLPGLDGVTLCRAVRRDSRNADTPILMLTARREESDKVLGLDSGADDLPVRGDAHRLEQALQNIAANAIRHTPDRGRVELRGERRGDRVRIAVRDTGSGIPEEHLPHVFDRFYKADPSRSRSAGSGLGLSIVRAIVQRHGGTVVALNAPDGGAVFELMLPVSDLPAASSTPMRKE